MLGVWCFTLLDTFMVIKLHYRVFYFDDTATVLARGVQDTKHAHLLWRFLVAIDRRNGAEVAMETVKLAEEFLLSSDGLVVGLDLSGDPKVSKPVWGL